jgi:LmbE family N-acetylglucosaminyl deacetylase
MELMDMKLKNKEAEIFVPDGIPVGEALTRATHLAVSAHQDDIEIMAYDGILKCFGSQADWFAGVVVTNGAGSPRDDIYADYTDEQMRITRKLEQKKAAFVGEYAFTALLDYPSAQVKDPDDGTVVDELAEMIGRIKPRVIYTHNLADKHDTHIGTAVKLVRALRTINTEYRPEKLYGCEVWRNLDWVCDEEKVLFDVSAHANLAASLLGVFDSQICGGKRYDLATAGRRLGNATYASSHIVDNASSLIYAMDLTPLIEDDTLDIGGYVTGYIDRFKEEVSDRIKKAIG